MKHRINYGRMFPGQSYKADCTCGWTSAGAREQVYAAVHEHKSPKRHTISNSDAAEDDDI